MGGRFEKIVINKEKQEMYRRLGAAAYFVLFIIYVIGIVSFEKFIAVSVFIITFILIRGFIIVKKG